MLIHCPSTSEKDLAALLQRNGIKPTAQRIDIARLLLEQCTHLSADDVYTLVNPAKRRTHDGRQRVSMATVYNTLGLFAKKGVVREVIADPNKIFYDPNTRPHHHFYDVTQGKLSDIPGDEVAVTGLPALPDGTVLEGVDVVVRLRQAS